MIHAEKKARQLSRLYYNQGLDCAQIRDLSGAIDKLRKSLQFDKLYTPARNLLGLVYFETGEAVSALSEWVISKNIQPEDNIATDYIERVQSDQNRLDVINKTIRSYNEALEHCREGDDDMAAVALGRVIAQNPKLLKAYHLLALIEIKNEKWSRARRVLRRAAKIDRTNSTTLRFIKEVDERTGKMTNLDAVEKKAAGDGLVLDRPSGQVVKFREVSSRVNLLNIIAGLLLGILVVWFVIAPSVRKTAARAADNKVLEYSSRISDQEKKIEELNSQIKKLSGEGTAGSGEKAAGQTGEGDSYLSLLKAYQAFQESKFTEAADHIQAVDAAGLTDDAKGIYNSLHDQVMSSAYTAYLSEGQAALYQNDYDRAVSQLEKAVSIQGEDYDALEALGLSYQYKEDYDKAIEIFQKIIKLFPDSRRSQNAEYSITLIEQATGKSVTTPGDTAFQTSPDGGADTADGTGVPADPAADGTTNTGTDGTQMDNAFVQTE